MSLALAMLFRPDEPKFELFETDESDIRHIHDYMIPLPKAYHERGLELWFIEFNARSVIKERSAIQALPGSFPRSMNKNISPCEPYHQAGMSWFFGAVAALAATALLA